MFISNVLEQEQMWTVVWHNNPVFFLLKELVHTIYCIATKQQNFKWCTGLAVVVYARHAVHIEYYILIFPFFAQLLLCATVNDITFQSKERKKETHLIKLLHAFNIFIHRLKVQKREKIEVTKPLNKILNLSNALHLYA